MRGILILALVFGTAGAWLASWAGSKSPEPVATQSAAKPAPQPMLVRASDTQTRSADGRGAAGGPQDTKAKAAPAALPLVTMSGQVQPPRSEPAAAAPVPAATLNAAPVVAADAVPAPVRDLQIAPPKPTIAVTCIAGCGTDNGRVVYEREVAAIEAAAAEALAAQTIAAAPDAPARPRSRRAH